MGKKSRKAVEEPVEESEATEAEVDEAGGPDEESDDPTTSEHMDSDEYDDDDAPRSGRRSRLRRFASKLMDQQTLSVDTKEILGSVLATSDKARTEAVKLVAREVRSYLDALELKETVQELVTSYSLEVSISLKPLARDEAEEEGPLAPVTDEVDVDEGPDED